MLNYLGLLAGDAPAEGGASMTLMLVIYGGFFLFMYLVLFRPQRKKQKAIESMQSNIKLGDSILTTGGLYGVVVDKVNDVLMVEFGTNKSVRVPVVKSAVASVTEPNLTVVHEEEPKKVETKKVETKKDEN